MAIEPIIENEHFHEALVKLANPFFGKPRVAALLRALIRPIQRLEDSAWESMAAYELANADTSRLNVLGRVVGMPRFWSDDEVYRSVVRGKIRTNKSRGLTDDLIEVIHLATASTMAVGVEHYVPATCTVVLGEEITDAELTGLEYLLPKTRSAGIQLHVFRPLSDDPLKLDTADSLLGSLVTVSSGATMYATRRL